MTSTPGPLLFARYAYPPNALGYCGPADPAELLEYAGNGVSDRGLVALARRFDGAWPYLSLIAAASGREPLDARVVEAYWLGNDLLTRVPGSLLAAHLADRFDDRLGPLLADPSRLALLGGRPHHNFHVFAVYPWTGLLRAGSAAEPLRVLDSCRISWGTVTAVGGDDAMVRWRPLRYDAGRLRLGEPVVRRVFAGTRGHRLAHGLRTGDRVSVHWDWICDVLSAPQLSSLRRITRAHLALVNDALGEPAAARALEPVPRGRRVVDLCPAGRRGPATTTTS